MHDLLPFLHGWDWDDIFWWGWWDGFRGLRHGLFLLTHLVFAYFVHQDARRRPRLLLETPAWLWSAVTLVIGVWGALAYWLANRSRWFQEPAPAEPPRPQGG
ncbi:MAG TPA: hypothetical protein VNK43_06145 [Gemmatimonadales bacterium]|nr:hypothetical protein [Gemmatimonadales bacterium]